MMQRGISPTRKVIELRKTEIMTQLNILKNGVRTTKLYCFLKQGRLVESPNYFGGGHFMIRKDAFPEEYKVFCSAIGRNEWCLYQKITDKDVKKAFARKSGKPKLFEPATHDDYTLLDGDSRFNSKYYWYLCKVLGCKLYFGDYVTPVAIKKDNKTVGFAMGLITERLGHPKRKAASRKPWWSMQVHNGQQGYFHQQRMGFTSGGRKK